MSHTDAQPAYDSPLEVRALAGDVTGVMDLIDAMDPAERASNRRAADRLIFNRWAMLRQDKLNPLNTRQSYDKPRANRMFRAIDMARFMCSPEHPQCDYWMHIGVQDIAAFKQRYQPTLSTEPIEKQLRGEHNWHYPHHIHRAVIAGLVERPQTEEYVDALYFGDLRAESNVVLKHVDADPGLAPLLLLLFEREGSSDGSFAAREKYCHDPELHWSHAFLTLCERGVYTRTQLLDKTLGALACDWPQFKSSWFSRFHEMLAPTVDEMAPCVARYLALCHSRIAPTVSLATDAVALLYKAGHVDDEQLCEAMQPVITSAVKARVLAALELLGQVVKNTPERALAVSTIAAHALAHTGSDVQKKAIGYLQTWGLDAAGQEVARGYLPLVSAVNQAALAKLVGSADSATARQPSPSAPQNHATPATAVAHTKLSPLDPSRALHPLTHIPDLVERLAYVFENPADVDEWERVAEALVRLAPIPAQHHAAFLALKKRTRRLDWSTKPLAFAMARLMACAVDGEGTTAGAMTLQPEQATNTETLIAWRAHSLIAQAALGLGLTPLSTPTHRGGFIDPQQLVTRIAAYQQVGAQAPVSEQVFAILRLVPTSVDADAASAALHATRTLQEQPLVQAVRHALGDTVRVPPDADTRALFVAAARIRAPLADDAPTLATYGDIGPDGPACATFDWHVTSSDPNDGGYVFHTLHVTHTPKLQAMDEHHYAMALCAKHVTGQRWGNEGEASNIRFAANLLPSGLESFFAEAARILGNNLDWWEAQWQNRAYLDVLLEPTTPFTPMARLTLALALAGKEPGQTALAVDALVRSVQDGRLDTAALGETLARLWATPLVKGPRLGKSLAAAAQAHATMPEAVFALLCAMVVINPGTPRKDLSPLLELLLELQLAHQLSLPPSTRATLAAMRLTGKNKVAAQSILG